MILIISQSEWEKSTNDLIDWLDYFGANYKRINGIDVLLNYYLGISNDISDVGQFDMSAVNVVWFRRWLSHNEQKNILLDEVDDISIAINDFHRSELGAIMEIFLSSLSNSFIVNVGSATLNKMLVLHEAKKCGIDIPDSLITTNKLELELFIERVERIITKGINNSCSVQIEGSVYSSYTSEVTKKSLDKYSDKFLPTLFQELLVKDFEVRVFVIGDAVYSMAICSQDSMQTSLDFRMYNYKHPNRCLPVTLPAAISTKVLILMDNIGLQTGSIDFVVTKCGRWVFLEINPEGQYGMVSSPCNYNVDKEIAKYLIKKDKEYAKN